MVTIHLDPKTASELLEALGPAAHMTACGGATFHGSNKAVFDELAGRLSRFRVTLAKEMTK